MATIPEPSPVRILTLKANQTAVGGYAVCHRFGRQSLPIEADSLGRIQEGVNRLARESGKNPDREYLVTKVGVVRGNFTPEQVAEKFAGLVFRSNVHLPKDYLDILAEKAVTEAAFADRHHFSEEQKDALRQFHSDNLEKRFTDRYKNFRPLLPEAEDAGYQKLIRLMAEVEADNYRNTDLLNNIRGVMECVFRRLRELGVIKVEDRDSDSVSECGKAALTAIKNKKIPVHIGNFCFSIVAVVNPGSHVSAETDEEKINFTKEMNAGHHRYLLRACAYDLLCILEWTLRETEKKNSSRS